MRLQHITSLDPFASPSIDPNVLNRNYGGCPALSVAKYNINKYFKDIKAFVQAMHLRKKITEQEPLASLIASSIVPPPSVETDEQLETLLAFVPPLVNSLTCCA